MTEYKIGAISKLFGIPTETLRYYESLGILVPKKDSVSGYRSYTPWEVNDLIMCRAYRSYGFLLTEVEQMMHADDEETLLTRFAQREAELIDTIRRYQTALQILSKRRNALANAENMIGRFVVENSPELLFLCHRHCYDLNLSEKVVELSRKWIDAMPATNLGIEIPQYSAVGGAFAGEEQNGEYNETNWGLFLSLGDAAQIGLKLEPPVKYIAPRKSVHTVLEAGERGMFLDDFTAKVIKPIREQGYQPNGAAVGQMIAYLKKEQQFVRYFDIWVPVQ